MEKVILITSNNFQKKFLDEWNKLFENQCKIVENTHYLNEQLLSFEDERFFFKAIDKETSDLYIERAEDNPPLTKKMFEIFADKNILFDILLNQNTDEGDNNTVNNVKWFEKLSDETAKKDIIKTAKEKFRENDNDSHNCWGELHRFTRDGTYFYLTHDFFITERSNVVAEYLNAIVKDIVVDLSKAATQEELNQAIGNYQWILVCHSNNLKVQNFENNSTEKLLKSKDITEAYHVDVFNKIIEKEDTTIIAFHHSGKIGKEVIGAINNDIVNFISSHNGYQLIEYLSRNVDLKEMPESTFDKIVFREDATKKYNPNDLTFIAEKLKKSNKPLVIYNESGEKVDDFVKISTDRRVNFLDSSIWLRYSNNTLNNDNQVVKDIENYEKIGLYQTANAKEIKEFKTRLLLNSYLDKMGNHDQYIVPFLFHSETKMHKWTVGNVENMSNIKKYISDNNGKQPPEFVKLVKLKEKIGKLEWRFLLIDDHAQIKKYYKGKDNNKYDDGTILPKCLIIYSVLAPYFNIECFKKGCGDCLEKCREHDVFLRRDNGNAPFSDITIYLDCAMTVDEAKNKIGDTSYDLILIDYLLNEKKDNERHYAYELLLQLKELFNGDINEEKLKEWIVSETKLKTILEAEKNKEKFLKHWKRPNGKFHFFFISAFTNAIYERMLAEGLNFHSEIWTISRGACPTTTPHLFLYYLLRFMNRQIDNLKTDEKFITLHSLLTKIYCDNKTPRINAMEYFNSLLHLRLKYDKLKHDSYFDYAGKRTEDENLRSPLIKSLFTDIEHYDNAFWEHLTHLVYLTAYGTIRQWSDMWEEYMLIKGKIKNDNLLAKIEEYIVSLRKDV